MNQKKTIQQFAQKIAEKTGAKPEDVFLVLKKIFSDVTQQLHTGTPVTIPRLGSFHLSKEYDQGILFTPDTSIAEEINSPFQAFEAVTLSDDFVDDVPQPDTASSEQQQPQPYTEADVETIETDLENDGALSTTPDDADSQDNIIAPSPELQSIDEETSTKESEQSDAAPSAQIPEIPPVQSTPPPYDPIKAYAPPSQVIAEDEELFAENHCQTYRSWKKFAFGLISGFVIALGLLVLALFAYIVFFKN